MNDYEKTYLREHWSKPGNLRMLLKVLPLTPEGQADDMLFKKIARMTGAMSEQDMAQVYTMLEEDGIIARDEIQAAPAARIECMHPQPIPGQACHMCQYLNKKSLDKAYVRYHLTKPLEEY